ncbi:MAG: histidine ammonia-lyase, partial [Thermoleophilia bacterium]|nr:histidine ammonia-lyase [Thermoleophilia bacterium]
ARALDLRKPLEPGPGTGAALASVRAHAEGPGPDRWLSPELAAVEELARSGELLEAVEGAIGALA